MLGYRFKKTACLKASNFIKKILQHKCFFVNIAKFLRTAFLIEHLWWLLLRGIKRNTLTITFPFKQSGEGRYERLSLTGDLYSESES